MPWNTLDITRTVISNISYYVYIHTIFCVASLHVLKLIITCSETESDEECDETEIQINNVIKTNNKAIVWK